MCALYVVIRLALNRIEHGLVLTLRGLILEPR